MNKYSPFILRLGLAFVFVWFGLNQVLDQGMWASLIPRALVTATGLSPEVFVMANGLFEIAMAILLAFGIKNRVVASLLFVHMFAIIADVGLSAVGIRDIGLMAVLLSIAVAGADEYSLLP